jgi:hypothetical protein
MEEGIIINIHLKKGPIADCCQGKKAANGGQLSNWSESFMIVQAFYLSKSLGYQACFIPFH